MLKKPGITWTQYNVQEAGSNRQPEAPDKHQRNDSVVVKALDSDLGNLDSTLNSLAVSWIVLGEHLTLLAMSTLPIFNSLKCIPKDQFPGFPGYFSLEKHLSGKQNTQETPVASMCCRNHVTVVNSLFIRCCRYSNCPQKDVKQGLYHAVTSC